MSNGLKVPTSNMPDWLSVGHLFWTYFCSNIISLGIQSVSFEGIPMKQQVRAHSFTVYSFMLYILHESSFAWMKQLTSAPPVDCHREVLTCAYMAMAAMVSDCPCGIWGSVPHARRVQEAGGDAQLLGFLQPKAMLGLKSFGERCLGCFHLFPVLICFFMFFFFILVCCLRSGWSEYHGLWRTLTSQCQCCIMYLEHSDCEIGKQSQFAFSFLKIAMWSGLGIQAWILSDLVRIELSSWLNC